MRKEEADRDHGDPLEGPNEISDKDEAPRGATGYFDFSLKEETVQENGIMHDETRRLHLKG